MENISKVGDILNLENNESYNVVFATILDNKSYLGIIKIPSDVNKLFDSKVEFVEETIDENQMFVIVPVRDKTITSKLSQMLNIK